MSSKISLISDRQETTTELKLKVFFKDGEVEEYVCHYMGHSVEYPPMIVLLKENGDETIPVAVLNSDEIKKMSIVEINPSEKVATAEQVGVH